MGVKDFFMNGIFNQINDMQRLLNAKNLRNEVISNNIANVDTPGFKRADVSFEQALIDNIQKNRIELKTSHKGHINNFQDVKDIKPEVYVQGDSVFRTDKNNVDIDTEMVELTKNTLSYNILAQQVQTKFALLRAAISEGRR